MNELNGYTSLLFLVFLGGMICFVTTFTAIFHTAIYKLAKCTKLVILIKIMYSKTISWTKNKSVNIKYIILLYLRLPIRSSVKIIKSNIKYNPAFLYKNCWIYTVFNEIDALLFLCRSEWLCFCKHTQNFKLIR